MSYPVFCNPFYCYFLQFFVLHLFLSLMIQLFTINSKGFDHVKESLIFDLGRTCDLCLPQETL